MLCRLYFSLLILYSLGWFATHSLVQASLKLTAIPLPQSAKYMPNMFVCVVLGHELLSLQMIGKQFATEVTAPCGSLNEMLLPHSLRHLNTWLHCLGRLRRCGLAGESTHWAFRIQDFNHCQFALCFLPVV